MDVLPRADLLATLELVEPALGTAVPQFSRIWFSGERVFAFSDDIGIAADLATEFTGGVDGKTLLRLLGSSKAETVEFQPDSNALSMKMGRARPKLASEDIEYADWALPESSNAALQGKMPAVLDAIQHCMRSIGGQLSMPESMGVTFESNENGLTLYSVSDDGLSKATVQMSSPYKFVRVTVHRRFCELMLSFRKKKLNFTLEINPEYALIIGDGFGASGRTLSTPKPINFEQEIMEAVKDKAPKPKPIPSKLSDMTKRALLLCDSKQVQLTVKAGKRGQIITINAKSDVGQIHDSLPFDHPNVSVTVNPANILAGCNLKMMSITPTAIVMSDTDKTYVINAQAGK